MARIVLAMSGGVDSSVAAHLLCRGGHEVTGVFMRHGANSPLSDGVLPIVTEALHHKQGCCSASDAADARRVADQLGIPFYALDLSEDFSRIMDYFVAEYTSARTPNPCMQCNNWIKFGKLFDYADSVDAEFVATGHYARIGERHGAPTLLRGVDTAKDQSYVLAGIAPRLLPRMMLPLGGYRKPEIRRLATELGLRVANKPDSQEICFVSRGKHAEFVAERRGAQDTSGELVTTDGTVVGTHAGIERFTVGQRKKLGVAFGTPRYVVRIEADTRRVVLGTQAELGRRELTAGDTNWYFDPPPNPFHCRAQIRYNSADQPATVEAFSQRKMRVTFDTPQAGVAPGQAVVCYDQDRVLGSGWIE